MFSSQPIQWEARSLIGIAAIVGLVIFQAVPIGQWAGVAIYPNILLLAVYYWSVFQPQRVHPMLLFMLGLLSDIVTGAPLGIHPLMLLLVRSIVLSQRRLFLAQQFLFVWLGMFVTALFGYAIIWISLQIISDGPVSVNVMLVPIVSTVLLYPLWHWLCDRLYKADEKR